VSTNDSNIHSVFQHYELASYPHRFAGELFLPDLVGGIPSDPKVAEGWLRTKVQGTDERIRQMVAETMAERGVTQAEALEIVNSLKNLNGFKRDENGLYIEGRQLKAAIKEAVSVAVGAEKLTLTGWGKTKKYLTNYLPEHVFVVENRLWLLDADGKNVQEATGIYQNFVHTHRGDSIQYQEYVENCRIQFTVVSDHPWTPKEWAMIWTTGQHNGLGASRSQGHGVYSVTKWERLPGPKGKVVEVTEEASEE
jgi:hypothetical protein